MVKMSEGGGVGVLCGPSLRPFPTASAGAVEALPPLAPRLFK